MSGQVDGSAFVSGLQGAGLDFFTGVPCSFLTPLMNAAISMPGLDYVGATSEGEAVAIASGAWLGGRMGVVMMQNSGLGNAVNPITSLSHTLDIPCLLIVTWRGAPNISDEPQHKQMGQITKQLLTLMDVPVLPFPESDAEIPAFAAQVAASLKERRRPVATILPKGRVASAKLVQTPVMPQLRAEIQGWFSGGTPPKRSDVLSLVTETLPLGTGFVATTGFCARELFATGDEARNLYVVGSMGGASAIGLGTALASDRPIAVLDGDGAMLMKMGNLATIGAEQPKNLTHILLDNGIHESTGRQGTVAPGVDFAAIAVAAGYASVHRADTVKELKDGLVAAFAVPGPRFLHVRVRPSEWPDLPRPNVAPSVVAARFKDYLAGDAK